MICENCQTTQASYNLKISLNQGQSQMSLCTECYEIALQKLENGSVDFDDQMFNQWDSDDEPVRATCQCKSAKES